MKQTITVFENANDKTQFYTFTTSPISGETTYHSVYFPTGYRVKDEDIKVSKNGKRFAIVEAEKKVSSKTGKIYFQVVADTAEEN